VLCRDGGRVGLREIGRRLLDGLSRDDAFLRERAAFAPDAAADSAAASSETSGAPACTACPTVTYTRLTRAGAGALSSAYPPGVGDTIPMARTVGANDACSAVAIPTLTVGMTAGPSGAPSSSSPPPPPLRWHAPTSVVAASPAPASARQ
jgi:hypothetical protein